MKTTDKKSLITENRPSSRIKNFFSTIAISLKTSGESKTPRSKLIITILLLVIVIIFGSITFWPPYHNFELSFFDLTLRLRPPIPEDERILFFDIDDTAITNLGVWPWPRNVIADALIVMAEFQTDFVALDIEYTEQSPLGLNAQGLQTFPAKVETELTSLQTRLLNLANAGALSNESRNSLFNLTQNTIIDSVSVLTRDNDDYFGEASRLHGNVYFTIRMLEEFDPKIEKELIDYALDEFGITIDENENTFIRSVEGISPSISPLITRGNGLGFPNVVIDDDGTRRRVHILQEYKGKHFRQLASSPMFDFLEVEDITVGKNSLTLHRANDDDPIVIPVSSSGVNAGTMLISWPKKEFEDMFRHKSFYELILYKEVEARLMDNIQAMNNGGYLNSFPSNIDLIDIYNQSEAILEHILDTGQRSQLIDYRTLRATLFAEVGRLLDGNLEQSLLEQVDTFINNPAITEEIKAAYQGVRDEIPEVFRNTFELFEEHSKIRATLEKEIKDAFIFIGYTGTGTTDIGTTPFDNDFKNVGTHASIANSLLQQEFIRWSPDWVPIALLAAIGIFLAIFLPSKNATYAILFGIGALIFTTMSILGIFLLLNYYISMLSILLMIVVIIVVHAINNLISTIRERNFIHDAFGRYLSQDVIQDLLQNPDKLSLGGETRELTAMFSDIAGFSTISEKLQSPSKLVALLNQYLTLMSDQIIALNGTVDKYEGDAIIAFFGAPVIFEDHAVRACSTALLMKQTEAELNKTIVKNGASPTPLSTRIGINTGEMVVGNMGTTQKMDYTIMGNSVNLAARLEGVNKQFGTYIMISEFTKEQAGDDFIYRKLDRVRVVGIDTPVRLYELIATKKDLQGANIEMLELFDRGITAFENKDWKTALKFFTEAQKADPNDVVTILYIERCKLFQQKAPDAKWDGVYNLTEK